MGARCCIVQQWGCRIQMVKIASTELLAPKMIIEIGESLFYFYHIQN